MSKDNLSALAAAAAFYALLSIFPTLTALVSFYGLAADRMMVESQVAAMDGVLPPEAVKFIATWLQGLVQLPAGKFGAGLLISVLVALWSLSAGTGLLMTALNVCYGVTERRSFLRFHLEALALSVGLVFLGAIALALVAGLPLLLSLLPASTKWHGLISLVRWPLLAGLSLLALAIVYRFGPAGVRRKWQWISWGAAVATALWLVGSVVFTFYVAEVGSYEKTYGSLGAVIILLLWFYMTAYVILIGAELNAELDRQAVRLSSLRLRDQIQGITTE